MTITRSSSGGGVVGSVSLGTNYAGDLVRLVLVNFSNSTTPNVPSGYTNVRAAQDSTNGFAYRVVQKLSTGGESLPAFTNTSHLGYIVYGGINATNLLNSAVGQSGSGTSASYSGIVSYPNPGVDWVALDYIGKNASGVPTAPNSATVVVTNISGGYIALFDSNGPLNSYSFNSKAVSVSSAWLTSTYIISAGASGGPSVSHLFFQSVRP